MRGNLVTKSHPLPLTLHACARHSPCRCGCTCAPIDAKVNGWALAGCGTEAGFYCGCGNSKVCTKSQTCVYPK